MSISAAHATAFFDEIGPDGSVWTIEDDGGVPAPMGTGGRRAMPFWSRRSRAERIIATSPAYEHFRPLEVPRPAFERRWLPGLRGDGIAVGINWSGKDATGYDLTADEVLGRLASSR